MKVRLMLKPYLVAAAMACLLLVTATESLLAQSDSITLMAGRPIRGTVKSFTPDNIVVSTSDGEKKVTPWGVRLIRFDGSNELVRAKSAYADGRYTACLDELQGLTEPPSRDMLTHEIDFYRAAASVKLAMQGGKISIAQAAREMDAFIKKYPNSYHLYPAMDMFGALAMASGRFDAATAQFEKTSAGPWPSLSFYGKLNSGKAKLYSGNYDAAIAAFKATEADPSAEGYAIQAKLIAQCLRAQALALAGQTKEGKELVMQIIENESSKNIELFAHANNALGVCFNEEQQTKEAIRAFLKTDLLFTLDPDSHAQALYHLVNLWANSERPDRAASARQKLTQRYRNTYWASKLK